MAKVTFITKDGKEIVAEASDGTLMELAKENDVEGIDGDCGGVCSCATCHVKVRPEWIDKLPKPDEAEQDMLEFETVNEPGSRFSCQIEITEELDGLVVDVDKL